jgi:hypothetical protein
MATGLALQSTATGGMAQIWPGRIATLVVAILLGPWYGATASAIAASANAIEAVLCIACPVVRVRSWP